MIPSMSELARRLTSPPSPPRRSLRAVSEDASPETRLRGMVTAHFDFVWRNLRRIGTSAADADEFTQEAFVIASRRLGDIFPHAERSFLLTTALRIASTHRRGASREQARIELSSRITPEPPPSPEDALSERQARARLDEILAAMDLDLRAVFVLYELEELTAPMIAELLELKLGTVSSRLRRAREFFKELTREEGFSP